MNPILNIHYQCLECDELHDYERDAQRCCEPGIVEVELWRCAECGADYGGSDGEDEARRCCWDGVTLLSPTHAELEAAGQQRLAL